MVTFTNAQSTKPSTPTFTLLLEDNGVGIYIQNQPILPNGNDDASIFYDIRMKWHESTNWFPNTVPDPSKGIRGYIAQINSNSPEYPNSLHIYVSANSYYDILGMSSSHQIDYQIRAINGYLNHSIMYGSPIGNLDPHSQSVIIVDTSDWSETHTIGVTDYTSQTAFPSPTNLNPSTAPTAHPTEPNTMNPSQIPSNNFIEVTTITLSAIVVALIVIVLVLFLFYRRIKRISIQLYSSSEPIIKAHN
jgi:hypothetical protein